MKKMPSMDMTNEPKSHSVNVSFNTNSVNKIAQIVRDPDRAATAASGRMREKALKMFNLSNPWIK